ncbi:GMC family oxidoreductase [Variovorax robiniae]|uniref:GMC family oxidoreductase n=1 Tax=Variovorax robiniae TaxID=1836199 RepID=A0ABU8X7F0_9BURK
MDYDIVIIGSGAGGGAMALSLAGTGARILILERGERLPREPQNNDPEAVFVERRYRAHERWQDGEGRAFTPGQYHFVGGHTKFYGTAMFRLREQDFEAVEHEDGLSPAWPIRYADLEPFYAEAEQLFHVHGHAGVDPSEPPRSSAYAFPPVLHEPLIGELALKLQALGLNPFHMPSAIDLREGGPCLRCGTCDAFPCAVQAKGDAEKCLVDPALRHPNVTLQTGSEVTRLVTDERGHRIVAAEVLHKGERQTVRAPLFVLSAGAINSALLLLRSATPRHPNGLANTSGCVGRHFMNHNTTCLMGMLPLTVNDTRFTKTLALNDFYLGAADERVPLGNVQMLGNIQEPMVRSAMPRMPRWAGRMLSRHSVDWLVMSEDLPHPQSTVRPLAGGGVELNWHRTNMATHHRFVSRTKGLLKRIGFSAILSRPFGIDTPSHQCGTVRMGDDPAHSVLDRWCRSHDHPNLFVVDASHFPSSGALNPALTIVAQGLRVGRHIRETT